MQQQPLAQSVSPVSGADLLSVCSGKEEEEEEETVAAPSRASRKRGGVLSRGGAGLEAGWG